MVSAFLDARTFKPPMSAPTLNAIGRLIRDFTTRCRAISKGPGFMFWVFHVIRDYARTLKGGKSRMADRLSGWLELSAQLEAAQCPVADHLRPQRSAARQFPR
jgi:hypothetical protein